MNATPHLSGGGDFMNTRLVGLSPTAARTRLCRRASEGISNLADQLSDLSGLQEWLSSSVKKLNH
jgi:hypothetical protein